LNTADYRHDPAGAVQAINRWTDANTNHKIPQLLSHLDPMTRLVLVNALYFEASWLQPFDPSQTRPGLFHTGAGTTVTAPFMHQVTKTGYASGDGWQAVDLPYLGDVSMTFIVPDAGRLADFERSLDAAQLDRILHSLQLTEVTLAIPKLHLADQADLTGILERLGMTDALTPPPGPQSADYSGITGNRDLYVSQVMHQATIDLDEKGTEAAAATAVAFAVSGLPRQAHLELDRPYLLLIRDHTTDTTLFLGRVADPTQTNTRQP
jgi:serpin B